MAAAKKKTAPAAANSAAPPPVPQTRNRDAKLVFRTTGSVLTIDVQKQHGDEYHSIGVTSVDINDAGALHADVIIPLVQSGIEKVIRSAAMRADVDTKFSVVQRVLGDLKAGTFARKQTRVRAPGVKAVTVELQAMAELQGVTIADVKAALADVPRQKVVEIMAHPDIVAKAAEIRNRTANRQVDLTMFMPPAQAAANVPPPPAPPQVPPVPQAAPQPAGGFPGFPPPPPQG